MLFLIGHGLNGAGGIYNPQARISYNNGFGSNCGRTDVQKCSRLPMKKRHREPSYHRLLQWRIQANQDRNISRMTKDGTSLFSHAEVAKIKKIFLVVPNYESVFRMCVSAARTALISTCCSRCVPVKEIEEKFCMRLIVIKANLIEDKKTQAEEANLMTSASGLKKEHTAFTHRRCTWAC